MEGRSRTQIQLARISGVAETAFRAHKGGKVAEKSGAALLAVQRLCEAGDSEMQGVSVQHMAHQAIGVSGATGYRVELRFSLTGIDSKPSSYSHLVPIYSNSGKASRKAAMVASRKAGGRTPVHFTSEGPRRPS